jgi:KaiC/GvpD/RAD55 family RecA-like ATPase
MFRHTLPGLANVIRGEVPRGLLILVTGGPGTLKSTLVGTILSRYLEKTREFGLYITLEESKESHLRNMASVGVKPPENLEIFDYLDIRREYGADSEEALDLLEGIESMIKFYKERRQNFTCIALDSLNALYSLIPLSNLRRRMYHFFDTFKIYGLTAFVVLEKPHHTAREIYAGEEFMADAIFNMGMMRTEEDITIYLQVEKLRGVVHSRKKYQIGVSDAGLVVLGPEYG